MAELTRTVLQRFDSLRAARPLVVWILSFLAALILTHVVFGDRWGWSAGEAVLAASIAVVGSLIWVTRQDDEFDRLQSDEAAGPELGVGEDGQKQL